MPPTVRRATAEAKQQGGLLLPAVSKMELGISGSNASFSRSMEETKNDGPGLSFHPSTRIEYLARGTGCGDDGRPALTDRLPCAVFWRGCCSSSTSVLPARYSRIATAAAAWCGATCARRSQVSVYEWQRTEADDTGLAVDPRRGKRYVGN